MRKPKEIRVTVRARMGFPIDMLRYDQAYPSTETDARAIERSVETKEAVTVVVVMDDGGLRPTHGRWASFGCEVLKVELSHG
jgi:hypothetical protein